MVKLIALKEVRYAGVNCVPGTPSAEFEASETDATLLKTIGTAADAPGNGAKQTEPVKQTEPAKSNTLFAKKDEAAEDDANKTGRRRYLRRDMRAGE